MTAWLFITFLLSVIILLPFVFYKPTEHRTFFICYFTVFAVHLAASVLQSCGYVLPGADEDAGRFSLRATEVMLTGQFKEFWVGAKLYENLLGILYTVAGKSVFLGCLTSLFAFESAFIILYRFIGKVLPDSSSVTIDFLTVLYALLPSTVIFTSVTMREPWELLFAVGCTYFSYFCVTEQKIKNFIGLFFFATLMLFVHNAFYIYCLFLPLSLILPFNQNGDKNDNRFFSFPDGKIRIVAFIFLLSYIFTLPIILEHISPAFKGLRLAREIMDGKVESYAVNYRESISYARSDYGVKLETFDARAFVSSLSKMILSYMFRPLPHEVANARDAYAFIECLLRFSLLSGFAAGWFAMSRKERTFCLFLGFHYGLLTFLWGAGTSNWGTAIRHHVSHQWLPVIMFGISAAALYRYFKKRSDSKKCAA